MATLIRLYTINVPADGDEALIFFWWGVIPWKNLLFEYISTGHKTLVAVLWRWASGWFGENEIVLRSSSWIPGILTIPLLYRTTVYLFQSKEAGYIAAGLLTFSYPHVLQSQYTKGYALTVFLTLGAVYCATKLVRRENLKIWGFFLFLTGFCSIVTIPSNAVFLVGLTFFYLISAWNQNPRLKAFLNFRFLKEFSPFLILACVSVAYIILIFPYLEKGMLIYKRYDLSMGLDPSWNLGRFLGVWTELSQPWGIVLYIFLIYGLIIVKFKRMLFPILSIFLFPLIIFFFKNISPPSRVLLYFLPFIFILTALGADDILLKIKRSVSKSIFNSIIVICAILVLLPVYPNLKLHYSKRAGWIGPKLIEAKKAREYLENNIPKNNLIVLPAVNRTLDHYMFDWVDKNNAEVLKNGKLEGIIFIGAERLKRFTPYEFLTIIHDEDMKMRPTKSFFEPIGKLPGIQIFRFPGTITRFSPDIFDPDFETKFVKNKDTPRFKVSHLSEPHVVGKTSLRIINKTFWAGPVFFINSPTYAKKYSILKNDCFLLLFYLEKYNQEANLQLAEMEKGSNKIKKFKNAYFMNFARGLFTYKNSRITAHRRFPMEWHHDNVYKVPLPRPSSYWQMRVLLFPISKGEYLINEVFREISSATIIDGIQSYLLCL